MNNEFVFATVDDIKNVELASTEYYYDIYHNYRKNGYNLINTEESPWNLSPSRLTKIILNDLDQKIKFQFYHISKTQHQYYQYDYGIRRPINDKIIPEPFFVSLIKSNFSEKIDKFSFSDELKNIASSINDIQYIGNSSYYDNGKFVFSVEYENIRFCLVTNTNVAELLFDLQITENMEFKTSNGYCRPFDNWQELISSIAVGYDRKYVNFNYTLETVNVLSSKLGITDTKTLLRAFMNKGVKITDIEKLSGVKKNWLRLKPIVAKIAYTHPLELCCYRSLASMSNKSINSVKYSSIFNDLFDEVKNEDDFLKKIAEIKPDQKNYYNYQNFSIYNSVENLDCYKARRKIVLKSKGNRAISKVIEEAESLTIDKKKHKQTWAEIESGNLAIGAFFRKSEQYYILNDNWDLWEEMFKRGFREETIALANEVKGRTTYEKDLMSYFYFILYALPEYLKKHTGHKWKCLPKLVNSSDELDPPTEEGGVARKRSALTPTVNNETKEVIVPYASLAMRGSRGTTYCYSHDYHVLTRGFSFGGNVVTKEIEEKLNGHDDYGLMFYTLTGSPQGRGYPTFLIIFERRESKNDTRVHFHRTHPSRSKQGDYNSVNNWISVCYNWMVGNINKDNIVVTQGDLAFVKVKTSKEEDMDGVITNLEFKYQVDRYDNHCFAEPVDFAEYTKVAKTNILGYVRLQKEIVLNHNEHDAVHIPSGIYAIHQCRSWEANPKGVWSLRID